MENQRKKWIDICKCIGIITVMLGHLNFSIPGGYEMALLFLYAFVFCTIGICYETG